MRQAGIIAAAALFAMDHNRERLHEDHEHARLLAQAIEESPGIELATPQVDTNIVIFDVLPAWGDAASFVEQLADASVRVFQTGPKSIRLVTHLDVDKSQIQAACQSIREIARRDASSVPT